MCKLKTQWILVFSLLLSLHATGAETPEGGVDDESATLSGQLEQQSGAAARIINLLKTNPGNFPLQKSLDLVNELLLNKSEDQDLIYDFVRTVNRNLDEIDESKCETCVKLVDDVRIRNSALLNSSYSDLLHQNANLSNQLRTRLANLIADSAEIFRSTEAHRNEFKQEYDLISERILSSSRFRVGLGVYNTFLPSINYKGDHRIDLSPYTSSVFGGADRLLFNTEFTNEYSANIILSARIPYVEINAIFPSFEKQNVIISPVQYREVDDSDFDLLSRSTINSTLKLEYEVSANISVKDIAYRILDLERITQYDLGIGIGAAGVKITDDISTEIRVETSESSLFADLPSRDAFVSGETKSYILPFVSLFYTFRVSDEIQVSIDFKQYLHPGGRDITESNDLNMSIKAVWFPTFNWIKNITENDDDKNDSSKS